MRVSQTCAGLSGNEGGETVSKVTRARARNPELKRRRALSICQANSEINHFS